MLGPALPRIPSLSKTAQMKATRCFFPVSVAPNPFRETGLCNGMLFGHFN